METPQIVTASSHGTLGVSTEYRPEFGSAHGAVTAMGYELRALQREYPIVLRKHPETGRFFLNALLGLRENENLYLDGSGGWRADYIPHFVLKGPFIIALSGTDERRTPLLAIAPDDPRVGEGFPNKLFEPNGKPSAYLREVNRILSQLHHSEGATRAMLEAWQDAALIEPLRLDIGLDNGEQIQFEGAFTIAEESLMGLTGKSLQSLHQAGHLEAAWYMAASIENVAKLVGFANAAAAGAERRERSATA